jgi:hypothetical protein
VADVERISQVEMLGDCGDVTGVVIHVVTVADLTRPAVTSPVMGNHAIALPEEVEHLSVPVVGTEGPAMVKDDGLGVFGSPVLEVDLDSVFHGNGAHSMGSFFEFG